MPSLGIHRIGWNLGKKPGQWCLGLGNRSGTESPYNNQTSLGNKYVE
jgi:hypothetical protein